MLKMKAILALCLLSVVLLSGCATPTGYTYYTPPTNYSLPSYGQRLSPYRFGYTQCVNVRNYTNAPLIVERPCGGTNVIVPRSWR